MIEVSSLASVLPRVSRSSVLFGLRASLLAAVFGTLGTAAHAQSEVQLPTIQVDSARETGTGPVQGYVAKQSVTATKTDTPVLEIPQTISVITKDQIASQQAQNLVEALRYTPAMTTDLYGANSLFDAVWVRGFQAQQYLDGLKLPFDPGSQFATPRIEPYGLERFEVLKGPSSGLYGQTNPGGFMNMVSKRPTSTPQYEVEGTFGSFDRFQGAFDLGGPADKNGEFLYRLVGLGRDSNTQIDFAQDNKLFIAPSFTWRPTGDTSFTLLTGYQKIDNKGYQQYVPAQGSLLPNPNGKIPYSRYVGEPSVDGYRHEQWMIGYAFAHRFNDVLQFRQNARFFSAQNDVTAVRSEGLQADLRTLNRSINYVASDTRNIAIDNQLQEDFRTGPLAHKVLVGFDYLNVQSHTDYRFAFISPLDVFNPVYGAGAIPTAAALTPFFLRDDTQKQAGVYIQDQIKWDRFTLSLTGRQDWASSESKNLGTRVTTSRDDKAFTGRAGLTYLFDFGLAPFASYSTSFIPVGGTDFTGNTYKPTTGEGFEAGLKYQPTGMNLLLTAVPIDHFELSFHVRAGGMSVGLPRGAPPSAQRAIIAISSALNDGSFLNF